MGNRRTQLRSIRRDLARERGLNAAAWFAGQSFTSASRGDVPLTQLSIQQLDQAGAGLLLKPEMCPDCGGSGVVQQQVTDALAVDAPCAECGGRGSYREAE